MGLDLPEGPPIAAGQALHRAGQPIGRVTTVARLEPSPHVIALAYVKRRHAQAGAEVEVGLDPGAIPARLVELPFRDGV
jgi:glycine cleavage system aminomethyltransferase T